MRALRLVSAVVVLGLLLPVASAAPIPIRTPVDAEGNLRTGGLDFVLTVQVWPDGRVATSCTAKTGLVGMVADLNSICKKVRAASFVSVSSDSVTSIVSMPGPVELVDALLRAIPGIQLAPAQQVPLGGSGPATGPWGNGEDPIVVETHVHWGSTVDASWARTCVTMPSRDPICTTEMGGALVAFQSLAGPGGIEIVNGMVAATVAQVPAGPSPPGAALAVDVLRAVLGVIGEPAAPEAAPVAPDASGTADPTAPGDADAVLTVANPGSFAAPEPGEPAAPLDEEVATLTFDSSGGFGDHHANVSVGPASRADRIEPPSSSSRLPGSRLAQPASPHAEAPSSRASDPLARGPAPVAQLAPPPAPGAHPQDTRLGVHGLHASRSEGPLATSLLAGAAVGAFWLLALLLYSRLKAAKLGEQQTREEILAAVRATPGLTPRGIAQRVGRHENTIRYHLRVLEKNGHLAARPHGARMHYFIAGEASEESATVAAVLRTRVARLLYETARSTPGIGVAEASALVGVHRTTLHYHASRLERAGLIALHKEPDGLRLYPRAS